MIYIGKLLRRKGKKLLTTPCKIHAIFKQELKTITT
jgi:hypothetical protein